MRGMRRVASVEKGRGVFGRERDVERFALLLKAEPRRMR